ncbi:MAG: hypothetical protein IGR92_01950 [Leptolyngbyaceae cyanobacterium T60_A2020_046]|nr:hypothetical protein [Leptolyngbyaceae cyanobacterium T60_A2020_046]
MTDTPDDALVAEVTEFVNSLAPEVLQELCDEMQAVRDDLEPRDKVLLDVALQRLAASADRPDPAAPPNPKAFERPAAKPD